MIDHMTLPVSDFKKSKEFVLRTLAPLGYQLYYEFEDKGAGFSTGDNPDFWILEGETPKPSIHVAFVSPDRETVDAFYKAAIAAGGKDNGKPGLRPEYHENYYAAFVLDPDGHNIEAVCQKAE